ncbi:MAG: HAD-IIA family hydrolase [Candidatus Thiodiazotropha sp.]
MTIRAVLLDMDGVLYHGDVPLPGAIDFVGRLADIPHLFLTNNPIRSPEAVAEKLWRMGFPAVEPSQVLTSALAAAVWLQREKPGFGYYAVGAPGLAQALSQFGHADDQAADFVVVGEGPGLDYETLSRGIHLIVKCGARLIVTNPDHNVDAEIGGEHRLLPGGGALVAPFAVATGVEPVVIGKPRPLLFEMALERLGCAAEECLMVGDRPDTDIAGAAGLGLRTALVRSGRFGADAAWPVGLPRPDWDELSLEGLAQALALPHSTQVERTHERRG